MKFSRFARRFASPSGTVQLMQDLADARHMSGTVAMLGGGNPAHIDGVQSIFQRELLRIGQDRESFAHMVGDYDFPQGNRQFCSALAAFLERHCHWSVGPENIAVTNGSQSSFGVLFNSLAGEFEDGRFRRVLLPITPEYVGYSDLTLGSRPLLEGRRPLIEILEEGFFKYHIDFDSLHIDDRYGLVCVSRPTNPTGNVIPDSELMRLAEQCRAAGVPLLIDGAYGLPFPGIVFRTAAPIWDENTILCLSLSKLGLPGLRTGIVIARPEIIELVRNANAINSLAPGRVGPELVTRLLEDDSLLHVCDSLVRPYYHNRLAYALDQVRKLMADLPVRIHEPEGALFLWLWFQDLPVSSEDLYQRLKKQGVFVLAGHHFYPGLEERDDPDNKWPHRHQCIRVNYTADPETIEYGLKIISDTVREAYQSG